MATAKLNGQTEEKITALLRMERMAENGEIGEAQPGDIICYPGHVAIYIGNGKIVHASSAKTGIKISNALYREIICVRRIV